MGRFVVGVGSDFLRRRGHPEAAGAAERVSRPARRCRDQDRPVQRRDIPVRRNSRTSMRCSCRAGDAMPPACSTTSGWPSSCRWGVGYDTVNLAECAAAGVVVVNAPEGVRRSMAQTAMAFVLCLAHRIFDQDRAMRQRSAMGEQAPVHWHRPGRQNTRRYRARQHRPRNPADRLGLRLRGDRLRPIRGPERRSGHLRRARRTDGALRLHHHPVCVDAGDAGHDQPRAASR